MQMLGNITAVSYYPQHLSYRIETKVHYEEEWLY